MFNFKNKQVITGGNSGIGKAIAEGFSEAGAQLLLLACDQDRLKSLAKHLSKAEYVVGDVSKLEDLDRMYAKVREKNQGIDVLVANAGIGYRKPIDAVDEQIFDSIVDINFKGCFFTVQKALPFLNEGASIILISSVVAHLYLQAHSVYSSSKAAVTQLAKNFASELADRKIRVNVVSPGHRPQLKL